MSDSFSTGPVHHFALTVSDVSRSLAFYSEVVGFEVVMESEQGAFLSNGAVGLGLRPSLIRTADDRFDENRVGLDHISFGVSSLADLEATARAFDERAVPRGEIDDLGEALGIYVLAFRDPDNIQLELCAPYA